MGHESTELTVGTEARLGVRSILPFLPSYSGCDRIVALAVTLVVVLLACRCFTDGRERFLVRLVAERASHVSATDRDQIAEALLRGEQASGVDALLLMSVMEEESAYRIRARSRRGAIGLMQLRPATARAVADRHDIAWAGKESLYEPRVNVRIGAAYLAELKSSMESWDLALTAYHRGPTAARRLRRQAPDRRPTSRYAGRILERHRVLREAYENARQ